MSKSKTVHNSTSSTADTSVVCTSDTISLVNDLRSDTLKILEILNSLNCKVKDLEKRVCEIETGTNCGNNADCCNSDSSDCLNDVEQNLTIKMDELTDRINERMVKLEKAFINSRKFGR